MAEDYTADPMQDRNSCAKRQPFEGGWSKAEFLAIEKRWSFLARLGERMAERSAAG